MLFSGDALAATGNIEVLGLPLSDFINAVIASVAVVGFIVSFIISILSLRQNREFFLKQNDLDQFEKRYEVFDWFFHHLLTKEMISGEKKLSTEEINNILFKTMQAQLLYKAKYRADICKIGSDLFDYYSGKPFPDYRQCGLIAHTDSIQEAYKEYVLYALKQLKLQLFVNY